jgi:hypothetical protein
MFLTGESMIPRSGLAFIQKEINEQPGALQALSSERTRRAGAGSVFVGAGDSYAASLIVSYMSSGRFLAYDPYVVLASPGLSKGRDVFFISVSGRTMSNVAAAKSLRGAARRTGITSDASSPLAKEVDEVILLPYVSRPRTVGTLSFTLSLLATMKLAFGKLNCDFQGAFREGRRLSDELLISRRGTTYFLGNQGAYGVSVYAAAKVYEILGAKAHAELLEEFSHLELFSLKHADAVNILDSFDPAGVGARLHEALEERNYESSTVRPKSSDPFAQLFSMIFAIQLRILSVAKLKGSSEPYFAGAQDKLDVSDRMIY